MRSQIKSELETLIKQIDEYRIAYGENDIRPAFLDGYFQILRTFFCSYYHLESRDIMGKYYDIYSRNDFTRDQISHHLQGHKNLLNSFLIFNSWSNFELFITLFCQSVLSEKSVQELLEIDYRRTLKNLKNYEISEVADLKFKKLIKNHLAHSPVVHKYGKLFKLIGNYPEKRDRNSDREFLELFGTLRNCIHSNYIYYGASDRTFSYNSETFHFKSGQLIEHLDMAENSIFLLTQNLKEIVNVFVTNISHEKEIYDPSYDIMI
jgi:hypothetical protein